MNVSNDSYRLLTEGKGTTAVGLVERTFTVEGMICGACVNHVERALGGVSGIVEAKVSLEKGKAKIYYDPARTDFATLRQAVRAAGYKLREEGTPLKSLPAQSRTIKVLIWPTVAGLIAAALLASLYITIVGVTQDFGHAIELVMGDWYFVVPIAIGFGVQVGLFAYTRKVLKLRKGARAANALTGAGTGTSTVSMVACCAHHLADVLPILGLSGAALFLNDNRGLFMALGIATNIAGIAVMVRLIRRIRSQARQTA